jgi:TraM recognition site of TraD and TraG
MTDPEIMAWVTPPRHGRLPVLDPNQFAASRDTLYLLSKSRSAAAPLIAALSDTAMRAAERRGGRLDPPLVVPLDEAANICRIADLPDLYSHLGSRGIIPVTILQSYEQGVTVWGEHGMAALWAPRPRNSSAPASTRHGWPATWPPSSGSTTSPSAPSTHEQPTLARRYGAVRGLPAGRSRLLATPARGPAPLPRRPPHNL